MKALALVLALVQEGAGSGGRWTKLADPAPDPLGREMSPGMMGAWVWVPEAKSFLLYGGRSPAFSNALWSFDAAKREWKPLVLCDRLVEDPGTKKLGIRRPGEIAWSKDRPAPGSDFGAVCDPDGKTVWLAGGWRYSGAGDWGEARFGTWRLDPARRKFEPAADAGPPGPLRLVPARREKLAFATPQCGRAKGDETSAAVTLWVLSTATGRWEKRASPSGPRWSGHPALAFDDKAGLLVLFDDWGQTWTYDPAKNAWTDARPAKAPPRRRHAGCWFDPTAGRVFLHGGITQDYPPGKSRPGESDYVAFYTNEWGRHYADVWSYDAAANEWREEKSEGAPATGKQPLFRDLTTYVPELKAAVLYDIKVGVWAYSRD